ncbi:MAG TPA: SDR family NAD(P)-dependent oxidoreductase [Caulobacteraceae bacterium]|jgi:NAD(P)-dependent dehydrogenase (short-subunit alcohol dehydrogenase family)|nr:SDR family NAD(P)-dependent oxidoreductase [Caulobacteraceae bacterium]
MTDIRFDGRVAIVTGAGRGLGREHALGLARRGAKVMVNDFGGARDGEGHDEGPADSVVAEIKALGGEAMAHGISVTDEAGVTDMVAKAIAAWGKVDILIANAGVLRDKSFSKMTVEDFRFVVETHLMGTVICAKAVWDAMRERNYGRIVVTTSSSGLYGNFGQSNYGAAKMGLAGLMQTLKLEGQKNDIRVNALAPVAATRMTEDIFPPELLAKFDPSEVTPGMLYLASDDAPTGAILSAGAGVFALTRLVETVGVNLGASATPEMVRDAWAKITDTAGEVEPKAGLEQSQKILKLLTA